MNSAAAGQERSAVNVMVTSLRTAASDWRLLAARARTAGQSSRRRVVSDVTRGYRILQRVREHGKELVARSGDMFGLVQLSRHVSALLIADLQATASNRALNLRCCHNPIDMAQESHCFFTQPGHHEDVKHNRRNLRTQE